MVVDSLGMSEEDCFFMRVVAIAERSDGGTFPIFFFLLLLLLFLLCYWCWSARVLAGFEIWGRVRRCLTASVFFWALRLETVCRFTPSKPV